MLIGQSKRVFRVCMWGKEAQAYLSFFSVRRGKSILKQKRTKRRKQGNVGSSTWKGMFGGIISGVMPCQHVPKGLLSFGDGGVFLVGFVWISSHYLTSSFPFLLDSNLMRS